LYESVPPAKYGGTERVVSYLTEELVRQGHEVTLFASGDSRTRANLVSPCKRSLRLDPECRDPLAAHIMMMEEVFRRERDFDIIHFHIDYLHYPVSSRMETPCVTTLHGRLDLPELASLYRTFPDVPLISISKAQRAPLPWVNWVGMVHHGLPKNLYALEESPEPYLVFLGRISPEKGVDRAIEIAREAGMPLRIAAKVDKADQEYFDEKIKPLLDNPQIEFVNEVGDKDKQRLLGKAAALLFPIDWPEPFGIVMIEAMACGTPVIAFPKGSVPEVIDDGVNGFIVKDIAEAVRAVENLPALSRALCRQMFEQRFSAARMAGDYARLFEKLQLPASPAVAVEVQECM